MLQLASRTVADMTDQRFLSRARVASILGVTPSTVTRWAKMGLIPTVVTVGGHHRYYEADIRRLERTLAKGRASSGAHGETRRPERTAPTGITPALQRGAGNARLSRSSTQKEVQDGMVEIRWHGRGGQGVVTAGEILAEAALLENRYFQAFPEFGPERTGAPVRAFTRISSEPITLHCPISNPKVVIVMDPTLLSVVDVFEGMEKGSTIVINSTKEPKAIKAAYPQAVPCKVVTVNATRIAMESFNRNVPNTPMLGALLRTVPVVSKESCLRFMQERLGARLSKKIVEANVVAFQRAYAEAQEG